MPKTNLPECLTSALETAQKLTDNYMVEEAEDLGRQLLDDEVFGEAARSITPEQAAVLRLEASDAFVFLRALDRARLVQQADDPSLNDMQLYYFTASVEAYDAVMTDESIRPGDLLIIPGDKVIGLAATWPIALTEEPGELHGVYPGEHQQAVDEQRIDAKNPQIAAHLLKDYGFEQAEWLVVMNEEIEARGRPRMGM